MTQAEKKKSTKTPPTSHREAPTKRQKAVNGLSARVPVLGTGSVERDVTRLNTFNS